MVRDNQQTRGQLFLARVAFFLFITILGQQSHGYDAILHQTFARQPTRSSVHSQPHKDWTFVIYIAADNDLRGFAARNIKQMAAIGSNNRVNIIVHLDIKISGNQKITRRYYIEKNRILHVNPDDPETQSMDSGNPQTLISCCKWAIADYPAEHYALIFWNHGTGILDPSRGRVVNPAELFTFNPDINKFELDRSIGFLDWIQATRGICWDDSTRNYLTNQKIDFALNHIHKNLLNGKKLGLVGFDACLMSMIEVASLIQPYAHVMVGSQEVELGTGWNYQKALGIFEYETPDPKALGQHIAHVYEQTYNKITNDYTQSAIDLDNLNPLKENINAVAILLIESMKNQKDARIKAAIKRSRNKLLCTHFDEPTYIDLHHFYKNLQINLKNFVFHDESEGRWLTHELNKTLEEGRSLIRSTVLANTVGRNLQQAHGISVYFPERSIHPSYEKTNWAKENQWLIMLKHCLTI